HGAYGCLVGGLFVALAPPFGSGNGGAFGDAHHFQREGAVQMGRIAAILDLAELHDFPRAPGPGPGQSFSIRISCGCPTMNPSAASSASASRTDASKVC